VKYSEQGAEVPSGSPTGLEDDQAGEEPSGSATHYQMAEPHHQGVEPSHQVARPLKNSSLNSSFNSSSHDKPYASLRPLRGDHSMEAPSVRPGEPGPRPSTYLANLVEEEQTPSPVNPTPAIEIPPPAPSCRVCKKPLTEGREITRRKCEACHAKDVAEQEKLDGKRAELRRVMATHSWDRAQTCVLCREHQDDIHYGLVGECTGKKSKSMAFDLED
jgi:hypothetical protein